MDNFRIYDTMFRFNNETERPSGGWRRNQKFVHDAYFWKILNMAHLEKLKAEKTKELVIELKRRGYAVKIERK